MRTTEPPLTMTIEEAGRLLGIGRKSAYKAAASGELPTVRFGRRLLVPRQRLMERLGLADDAAGNVAESS